MKRKIFAHISILGANLIFGLNYMIAKGIMPDYAQPYGLTVCRAIGAILMFWTVGLFVESEKIDRKDFKTLILAAFFGVGINQLLFLKGLSYASVINSAIIMTVIPIIVLVMAAILINEKITVRKIFGIILGAAGALCLILFSDKISLASDSFVGNLLMFLNACSYGIYLVIIKPMMAKYHPFTVLKWVFLFGAILIFPVGFNQFLEIKWSAMPANILFSVFYVIVFSTFFAYLLNIIGLQTVNSTTVSVYIYSQPVIATTAAMLFGKDEITWLKIISTILVFAGVYLVSSQGIKKVALLAVDRIKKNRR